MTRKYLLAAAVLITMAISACAKQPGDIIGTAYTADAAATLDGIPIPTYQIDDTTVISVEDLCSYGFTMDFDEESHRIDVITADKPGSDTVYPKILPREPGSSCGNVLYSDINTYINGVRIPSYNVDGNTYVSIEELGALEDEYNKEAGWSDYNFRYTFDPDARTYRLDAFRFDQTFGDAINESRPLADKNELELYTKGDTAPYYHAKHEPEKGVYAGINADVIDGFTDTFGVYSSYFEFDDRQTEFPKNNNENIKDKDCINLVPWNTSDVTQVWENDKYIRKTLDTIAATGKKTIVRFAAEMNIGDLGNSPTAYVKAFRRIADIVHEYDNLAIMWSPNDVGSFNKPYDLYYPGDEYVDWIGISSFLTHDFLGDINSTDEANLVFSCGDYAWTSVALKRITSFMEKNHIQKPVAISEGAVESSVTYADIPDLHEWGYPRLRAMYWYTAMKFPQVKMVTYFNQTTGIEVSGFKTTEDYRDIINECIKEAGYLTTASDTPEFTFVKADEKDGGFQSVIPLYAYVYMPHETVQSVEYIVGDKTVAATHQIPYSAEISTDGLSNNAALTIRITTNQAIHTAEYMISRQGSGYYLTETQPLN